MTLRIALPIAPDDLPLQFGDYCLIEQQRFGVPNEVYQYKVIGRGRANYYRPVPVNPHETKAKGELCDVVKVICCGICEETVETFRLQDVQRLTRCVTADPPWSEARPAEGDFWLSLAPWKREEQTDDVHSVQVYRRDGELIVDNRGFCLPLSDCLFDGARWLLRETPADPFAKEPTP